MRLEHWVWHHIKLICSVWLHLVLKIAHHMDSRQNIRIPRCRLFLCDFCWTNLGLFGDIFKFWGIFGSIYLFYVAIDFQFHYFWYFINYFSYFLLVDCCLFRIFCCIFCIDYSCSQNFVMFLLIFCLFFLLLCLFWLFCSFYNWANWIIIFKGVVFIKKYFFYLYF